MCPSFSLSKAWGVLLSLPHPIRSFVGLNAIAPPRALTTYGIPFFHTSMSAASEIGASPLWEGHWSAVLNKGDMWDTGVVSPALQKLLDQGVKGHGFSGAFVTLGFVVVRVWDFRS